MRGKKPGKFATGERGKIGGSEVVEDDTALDKPWSNSWGICLMRVSKARKGGGRR